MVGINNGSRIFRSDFFKPNPKKRLEKSIMEAFFTFWYKLVYFFNYSTPQQWQWVVIVVCLVLILAILYFISVIHEDRPVIAVLSSLSILFCCFLMVPLVSSLNYMADLKEKERMITVNADVGMPMDKNPTATDSINVTDSGIDTALIK
jgi:hypothetical protein